MNETVQQLLQRKSVRSFTDREIDESIVQEILLAAINTPTAGNHQLYTILRITDRELLHLPDYVFPTTLLVFGYLEQFRS